MLEAGLPTTKSASLLRPHQTPKQKPSQGESLDAKKEPTPSRPLFSVISGAICFLRDLESSLRFAKEPKAVEKRRTHTRSLLLDYFQYWSAPLKMRGTTSTTIKEKRKQNAWNRGDEMIKKDWSGISSETCLEVWTTNGAFTRLTMKTQFHFNFPRPD